MPTGRSRLSPGRRWGPPRGPRSGSRRARSASTRTRPRPIPTCRPGPWRGRRPSRLGSPWADVPLDGAGPPISRGPFQPGRSWRKKPRRLAPGPMTAGGTLPYPVDPLGRVPPESAPDPSRPMHAHETLQDDSRPRALAHCPPRQAGRVDLERASSSKSTASLDRRSRLTSRRQGAARCPCSAQTTASGVWPTAPARPTSEPTPSPGPRPRPACHTLQTRKHPLRQSP